MKQWFIANEIAGMPGLPGTESGVIRLAKREGWEAQQRIGQGGGFEYHIGNLPADTQTALAVKYASEAVTQAEDVQALLKQALAEDGKTAFSYNRETLWQNYERATENKKSKAKRSLEVLLTLEQLISGGMKKEAAVRQVFDTYQESRATVYRWQKAVKGFDRSDWLAALMPKHKGRTAAGADCTVEAWELLKADYLRPEKPSIAACYSRLQRIAVKKGWAVPAKRTIERWLQERIPAAQKVLLREGEYALMRMYPHMDRSVLDLHALQWINGDGYQHNVFVKWPDGEVARPKTWFWQDVYSRRILAYRVDVTENTDMLRLSFGDLVEQYGIPEHATIDNTRAAANKWMSGGTRTRYRFKVKDDDPIGIFNLLGVQVHWTSVLNGKGHGQAKPIERAFGVGGLGEYVDKHPAFSGAFTGENPMAKPDNYASKAVPLKKFLETLNAEVIAWNAQAKRRTEVCNGISSYEQAFNDSYATAPIRKATAEQRRLWLLAAEAVSVQRDGCVALAAGARVGEGRQGRNRYFAPEMHDYIGKKVVVRFDPQGLHEQVHIYSLDSQFIASADCLEAVGFGDTETGRVFTKVRKQFQKHTKQAARAQVKLDALAVAEQMPEAELPVDVESKVVRPMRVQMELPAERKPVQESTVDQMDQDELRARRQAIMDSQVDKTAATGLKTPLFENEYERAWWLTKEAMNRELIGEEAIFLKSYRSRNLSGAKGLDALAATLSGGNQQIGMTQASK